MTLGATFAEGVRSWNRTMALATPERRPGVFHEACKEFGGFVARGAPRQEMADAARDLALRHDLLDVLDGKDGIEQTIATAFDAAETAHRWQRANGEDDAAEHDTRAPPRPTSWRERFKVTALADIEVDNEPLWMVDSLIPAGPSLGVIFGKPKSGKTFFTSDLFLHVALGRTYCGCAVQQGPVLYITREGVRGFRLRMKAMRQHHKTEAAPFYVAHEMPNFGTNVGDADALVDLVRKLVPGKKVAAIIIDTLVSAMPGQSDSDTAAMSMFVANCEIVSRSLGCFVGAVHHSPRGDDTRSRGSNVLDGAADVIISVIKDEITHASTVKIEALKDGEEGLSWQFRLTQIGIEVGQNRNKKSCFAPLCETISKPARNGATETKRNKTLSPSQRRFVDLLSEAIIDHGQPVTDSAIVPIGIKAVDREKLKNILFDRGFLDRDKPDAARSIFSRTLNDLAGKHVIGTTADHVWLPK
jgi:hypothetical protein